MHVSVPACSMRTLLVSDACRGCKSADLRAVALWLSCARRSELAGIPTLLYGTTSGTIGVLASLPPALFDFLSRLQVCVRVFGKRCMRPVGSPACAQMCPCA